MAQEPARGKVRLKARRCEAYGCDDPLPVAARADARWCSTRCKRRMANARAAARRRAASGTPPTRTDLLVDALFPNEVHDTGRAPAPSPNETTPAALRATPLSRTPAEAAAAIIPLTVGGAGFQAFATSPTPQLILDGAITARDAARALNVTPATISAWLALYNSLTSQTIAAANFANSPAAQALRDHALSSFRNFCEVFFPKDLTPWFHEEWDESITSALDNGERNLLLASQRHGKTSFIIKQCLYRIANNPDIRIIWVGKTAALAEKAVGVIRQYLENDPHFASVLLPPDTSFKPPPRRGVPWTNSEFTVATRTTILTSPTMVALGVGGSILGRDADLIIIDDPIDRASCLSPTMRNSIEEWFTTDFNSRIEEHTGVVYIGSRQHKDDLPSTILKKNDEDIRASRAPGWNVLLYRAHDPACPHELQDHPPDKEDCILWPGKRTAKWLAEQQRNNPDHFERNYQANPLGTLLRPVREEDIIYSHAIDRWLSTSPRSAHRRDDPTPRPPCSPHPSMNMVASLDPAVSKKNAAVLWCYTTGPVPLPAAPPSDDPAAPTPPLTPVHVRAVVDYAEPPPGSPGIKELLLDWHERYGVTEWVFEANLYADQLANDADLNDIRSRLGLKFHTHWTTQHNKHDSRAGVLAMLSALRARPSSLLIPGATPEARRYMERFVRQLLDYDPEATHTAGGRRNSRLDDDLVMAAWFGWYWMQQRTRTTSTNIRFDFGRNAFEPSNWTAPPWKVA